MRYFIHFCNTCENNVEISVKGDAWCCGVLMENIGDMNEK